MKPIKDTIIPRRDGVIGCRCCPVVTHSVIAPTPQQRRGFLQAPQDGVMFTRFAFTGERESFTNHLITKSRLNNSHVCLVACALPGAR